MPSFDLSDTTPNLLPLVCCVVVNWNGWPDTLECLASLAAQDYPALRVLVVENGSTNDSAARIRAAYPDIPLLETGANLGFPSGCNAGIRRAVEDSADLIWLLNNDTVAPPDTCSKLVAHALALPHAGIVGSVLYYMHDPSQVQAWGGGAVSPWLGRTSHFHAPAPLGPRSYLTFASALIPREVFLRVGVLYEGFFMYWDDADLALRVTRAGYTLTVAQDTAILHKEGGSSAPRSPIIDRYSTAAGLHFLRRHSPAPPLSMAIFIAIRLASRALRGAWKNLHAVLLACHDYRTQRHKTYSDTL
jgi:GT2 family glycosyltransferase